jgi:hypothetical protein
MRKQLNFTDELAQQIQHYANRHHNGNFNQAVRELALKALALESNNGEPNND